MTLTSWGILPNLLFLDRLFPSTTYYLSHITITNLQWGIMKNLLPAICFFGIPVKPDMMAYGNETRKTKEQTMESGLRTGFVTFGMVMVLVILFCWSPAAAGKETAYVLPPVKLDATLIVPKDKIEGNGYKIDTVAYNDGYGNTYTLSTDVGEVKVVSDYQLARQIQEIQAILILDKMSRAGLFGDGMKEGVLKPLRGAQALVTAPVETTKGAVKGIGRWMGNIARAVKSDDPYQEGGVSAAVGWAGTKRAFALKLGVDPYTEWEPLRQSLTSVAKAAFAGGITVGVAMGAVTDGTTTGTVLTGINVTEDMNAILRDNPPEGLTRINREKLVKMGIPEKVADPFLSNYNYTPMEKTLMVESLRRMDGAKGRDLYVLLATAAPNKVMARYMMQRAEMMANYHTRKVATDFVKIGRSVWQINREGALVLVFPFDYLAWTSELSALAANVEKKFKAKKREVWLEGSASPNSLKALTARGWKVNERVRLLTGKPLQNQTAAGAGGAATGAAIKIITP